MTKEVTLEEFNKLSLEERAKIALKNYYQGARMKSEGYCSLNQFLESWAYLEEGKYVEIVGGTPKSGAAYKITSKGLDFMNKTI